MRGLTSGYAGFLSFCGEIPGIVVVLIVIGIATDVLLRNIGLGSIVWMIETVEYALFTLTFIGTAFVLRAGQHVTVDIVPSVLKPGPARMVAIFGALLMIAISGVFFYYSLLVTLEAKAEQSMLVKSYTIPEWWVLWMLPFAAFFLLIESLRRLLMAIRGDGVTARRGDGIGDGV